MLAFVVLRAQVIQLTVFFPILIIKFEQEIKFHLLYILLTKIVVKLIYSFHWISAN